MESCSTPTAKREKLRSRSFGDEGHRFETKTFVERKVEALNLEENQVKAHVLACLQEKNERAQRKRDSNLQRRRDTVSEHHRKIAEARRAVEGRMAMEAEELLQRHHAKQGGASRRRRMSTERIRQARAEHNRKVMNKRSDGVDGGSSPNGASSPAMDRIQLKLARAERNRRRLHERRRRRAVERFEAGKARALTNASRDADFDDTTADDDAVAAVAADVSAAAKDAVAADPLLAGRRRRPDSLSFKVTRQRQALRLQVMRHRAEMHKSRAAERRARSYAARLIQAWYRCMCGGRPFDIERTLVLLSAAGSPMSSPPISPRCSGSGGAGSSGSTSSDARMTNGGATAEGLVAALVAAEKAAEAAAADGDNSSDCTADSPATPFVSRVHRATEAFEHEAGGGSSAASANGAATPVPESAHAAARRIQALFRGGLHNFKVSNALLQSVSSVSALAGAVEAMSDATYDEAMDLLSERQLQSHCEAALKALRMGKEMRHVPPSVRSAKAFLSALIINVYPVTSLDDELPSPLGCSSDGSSSGGGGGGNGGGGGGSSGGNLQRPVVHPLALEKARLGRAAGNTVEAVLRLHAVLTEVAAAVSAPCAGSIHVADFCKLRRAASGAVHARVAFCLRFAEWKHKDAMRLADEMTAACVDVLLMQLRAERDLLAAATRYGLDAAEDASLFSTGFEQIKEGAIRQLDKMLGALCKLVGRDEARRRADDATAAAFERLRGDELEEEAALAAELRALEEQEMAFLGSRRVGSGSNGCAGIGREMTGASGSGGGSGSDSRSGAATGGEDGGDDAGEDDAVQAGVAGGARPLSAADLLSNEWLVHEVMVSDAPLQVTLDEAHENQLISERSQIHDSYWENVAEQFAARDLTPLLELVAELRDKIIGLTPRRRDLAAETSEAMDVELLGQMMRHGAFDYGVFFRMIAFAGERVLELEAPVRNDTTRAKLAEWAAMQRTVEAGGEGAPILTVELARDCFGFLFSKTDEIHVDILNAHLQFVTPFLKRNGVEYERDRFTEKLDLGELTLDVTHYWLHRAIRRGRAAAASGDTAAANLLARLEQKQGDSYLQLIRTAVVDEILGSIVRVDGSHASGGGASAVAAASAVPGVARAAGAAGAAAGAAGAAAEEDGIAMPETFAPDQYRLVVIAAAMEQVAYTAAMLAYARQTLAGLRAPLSKADEDAARRALMVLFETDDVSSPDIAAQVVEATRAAARRAGKVLPAAAAESLATRAANVLADGACPVYRLYLRRVLGLAKGVLLASKLDEPGFAHMLRGAGLAEYQEFMTEKVARQLLIIERHNEAVFAPFYNAIIPLSLRTADAGPTVTAGAGAAAVAGADATGVRAAHAAVMAVD